MEKNDQNRYLYNSATAGWSYPVPMNETKPEIISGSWSFPKAQLAKEVGMIATEKTSTLSTATRR